MKYFIVLLSVVFSLSVYGDAKFEDPVPPILIGPPVEAEDPAPPALIGPPEKTVPGAREKTNKWYESKSAKISLKHSEGRSAYSASVFVNHSEEQVELEIQPSWACADGMMCAAVMPKPLPRVVMRISSVKQKKCGGEVIKAYSPKAPESNSIQVVTTRDCRTGELKSTKATYQTSEPNVLTGKYEIVRSTMMLELEREEAVQTAQKYQYVSGDWSRYPTIGTPAFGSLTIGADKVEMEIRTVMGCDGKAPCKLGPGQVIRVKLGIVESFRVQCGRQIVANNLDAIENEEGGTFQELVIHESGGFCDDGVQVSYVVQPAGSATAKPLKAVLQFE